MYIHLGQKIFFLYFYVNTEFLIFEMSFSHIIVPKTEFTTYL